VSEHNEKLDIVNKELKIQIEQTNETAVKYKEEQRTVDANQQTKIDKNTHRYTDALVRLEKMIDTNMDQNKADDAVLNAAIEEQKKRVDNTFEKIETNVVVLNTNKTECAKLNTDTNAKIDKINQEINQNIQANKDQIEANDKEIDKRIVNLNATVKNNNDKENSDLAKD
jgi:hypothetical protein